MSTANKIIKRKGHDEQFDERKVYGSIYAAMLAAHQPSQAAELVASAIALRVAREVVTKAHTSSDAIKQFVAKALLDYNIPAQFLYVHHKHMF
jgi:transcriptional regulator NrdR family protein